MSETPQTPQTPHESGVSHSDRELTGYRGAIACSAAGISYRQLDYWARTGLVEPTIRTASGSGTSRLYSLKSSSAFSIQVFHSRTSEAPWNTFALAVPKTLQLLP